MPSLAAVLAAANEAAASAFQERDYVTDYGSASGKDPWDDETLPKDGWVVKVVDTFLKMLPQPPVLTTGERALLPQVT